MICRYCTAIISEYRITTTTTVSWSFRRKENRHTALFFTSLPFISVDDNDDDDDDAAAAAAADDGADDDDGIVKNPE